MHNTANYITMEHDTKGRDVGTKNKQQTCWDSHIIKTLDMLSEICTEACLQMVNYGLKYLEILSYSTDPDKSRHKALGIHKSLDRWHGAKNRLK